MNLSYISELDRYEKSKIDKYLRSGGNIQLTKRYKIDSPKISYYVINIFVMSYSDATDESVNSQILDKISEYFLNLNRTDRIPKLDIIRELSTIGDIHSVDIQFISKQNEDYHRENILMAKNKFNKFDTSYENNISVENINPNYNNNSSIGIDPVMGDILFESDSIPVIRGNFYGRNGEYYSDTVEGNGLRSVNIIKKGTIDSKNKNKI